MSDDATPFRKRWSMITDPVELGYEHPLGKVVVRMASGPDRPTGRPGEDAAAVLDCGPEALVIAVADGMGGQRGGARAAKIAVDALGELVPQEGCATTNVVEAFDEAQRRTRARRGAGATTMVVALITPKMLRLFNVGDSEGIVLNTRGRIKTRTTAQSPVGYLSAAGAISPDEALLHDYRHLLSSAIGIDAMRLEVCPKVTFDRSDVLVMGSDGMFDNVFEHEILDIIRHRDLDKAGDRLSTLVATRMRPGAGPPSKPDDMSFVLFRPNLPKRKPRKKKAEPSADG